jgi:putative peptide zinc metalloprotease protein
MATAAFGASARAWPLMRRRDLEVCALRLERRRVWGLKDPVAMRYFQLEEEEFWIFERLDGRLGLAEIQAEFERAFAPKRLELHMLQSFLRQLHGEGLILSDAPGQGDVLTTRRVEVRRRTRRSSWLNPLMIRFRGIDPEPMLRRIYPEVRWLFSPTALGLYLAAICGALLLVFTHWRELVARLPSPADFFQPQNALWFAVAIGLTKLLHELGHALACKHFGGECHEMGVMLFLFTPSLYCNVSDVWMLPDKWSRMAVSAAGIGVELVIAAVATFLWWFSEPGGFHTLCLAMMFVCTVNTLVLNGNPLMRYDGYHVLADFVEIPQLSQESGDVWRRWGDKLWFGRDPSRREPQLDYSSPLRTGGLAIYSLASMVYLWMITIGALRLLNDWAATYGLQLAAQAMTALAVVGMVASPAMRLNRRLTEPTSRSWIRLPRFWWVTFLVFGLSAAILAIPLPRSIEVDAMLRPIDAETVYVTQGGTLKWIKGSGTVQKGEVIAVLGNDQLQRSKVELEAARELAAKKLEIMNERLKADPTAKVDIPTAERSLRAAQAKLDQRIKDIERLTLRAPVAGTIIPARRKTDDRTDPRMLPEWSGGLADRENLGAALEGGTAVCQIGEPRRIEATAMIDQAEVLAIRNSTADRPGSEVELLIDVGGGGTGASQAAGTVLKGTVREVAQRDWNPSDEGLATGDEQDRRRTHDGATTQYQVQIEIAEPVDGVVFDTLIPAKIHVEYESLGAKIMRRLAQTFRFE